VDENVMNHKFLTILFKVIVNLQNVLNY